MHDPGEAVAREDSVDEVAIDERALLENGAGGHERGVAARQVVERDDLDAGREEVLRDVRADVTCSASY